MNKILVVEDEVSYLHLLHKELASKGYTVADAKTGKEGYDAAVTMHPDLIILDLLMPEVDGLTMLELLRQEKFGKSMKVIILTNLELDKAMMTRVLNAKPLYYFVKSDITLESLMAKIDEELTEQQAEAVEEEKEENVGVL
jgi:DNA-binding response OmpR family regulator